MKDILKEIVAKKKERLLLAKQQITQDELKEKILQMPAARKFKEAISKPRVISLIAEIKKSSPSAGVIRQELNIADIAGSYKEAGVQAVSVVSEEDFFGGSPAYINEVKNIIDVPVLRKDFIFEPYQVYESRNLGADAILLIAELLSKEKLSELIQLADSLGMACLVESHSEKELKKLLSLKVEKVNPLAIKANKNIDKYVDFLLGINNRDLRTLEVDLKTTEKLYLLIPKDKTVVVESGITSKKDVMFLKILGVSAVLVGEAFMRSPDIKAKVEEVMGW